MPRILTRRGVAADMPIDLLEGEFFFQTDTQELWVGSATGNLQITTSAIGDMLKSVYDTNGDGVLNVGAIPSSFATTTAVTAAITSAINGLVNAAPGALDTLKELADALGDDTNFAATMTTALAGKVPTTRTVTINGTAQDLSADRSFTVGNVRTDVVSIFTKQQNFGAVALTSSGGHIAWNLDNAQSAKHALTENTTLDNPTNLVDGGTYVLKITQHASAAKTLAFGSAYKWAGGSAPTISPGLGAIDIFTFVCDGVYMHGVCQKGFA